MTRYNNILDTIGNTPLVKLNKLAPAGVNVYVKIEAFNPMGSIKDRMARAVIEHAEQSGDLHPGQTVIEATSGNTGIGLAMVCAQKSYPLVVVMAENFSVERRKLLRFLGARVVLTPAADKGTGMLKKASELAEKHGYYLCRQFDNEANADIHSATTAQEIINDFEGETLHYWVSGFGTGGTLKGVSRALKVAKPETRVVVVEPDNSQVLGSGIKQPRDTHGSPSQSHPYFRPHLMQGWSPDFISSLTESTVKNQWVDEIVPVSGDASLNLSKQLAREEGIFVGISSGATLAGALVIARRSAPGTNIVCMLPDTGERYLSTPLFADISEEMTEEEIQLSDSTESARFTNNAQVTAATEEQSDTEKITLNADAEQFVNETIYTESVVMFALEWCEFCWAVRKLFTAMGVKFCSVDLDSVAYQQNAMGGKIRSVLHDKIGKSTIPQIFIGGKLIGGSTDLFIAYEDGSLQRQLDSLNIDYLCDASIDPASMLPQWLHPRKSA